VKARVLIVDDARCQADHTARLLEADGLEVVGTVGDGHDAVEAFDRLDPDLVTMDLLLPSCNGVEAVRQIRALDPEARVLVTSARGQEVLVMEALQAGARDFVLKPVDRERLLHALKRILPF
jgi:two-component system chemotaxis response regulator CheY